MADVDHSLYLCKSEKGLVFVTIYVDDLIIGGDHLDEVEHIKGLLKQEFEMKDLGELRFFLGIEIIRTKKRYLVVTAEVCFGYACKIWYV